VVIVKLDIRVGEIFDGEGGYTVFGKLTPAKRSLKHGLLPLGIAHRLKVTRAVPKDQPLTWAHVAIDESAPAYRARMEMERLLASNGGAVVSA